MYLSMTVLLLYNSASVNFEGESLQLNFEGFERFLDLLGIWIHYIYQVTFVEPYADEDLSEISINNEEGDEQFSSEVESDVVLLENVFNGLANGKHN